MPIGDAQLKTWSKHGSVAQSRDTYAAIKNVLENQDAPYSNKDFTVFLQGSYGNETNVYAESDVDIVMELQSTFYRDLARLSDLDRDAYENAFSNATYNHSDFKKDAVTWLMKRYGKAAKPGTKAIFVEENGNRRNADVLVAAQFRRYYQFTTISNQRFEEGICFFLSLRLGTRLVRGWRGVTHMVLIHADGIGWRGQRYRSLSVVARKITGARWSGPRFFGLRRRQLDSYSSARAGHGQG
jgi:hypothetical protein